MPCQVDSERLSPMLALPTWGFARKNVLDRPALVTRPPRTPVPEGVVSAKLASVATCPWVMAEYCELGMPPSGANSVARTPIGSPTFGLLLAERLRCAARKPVRKP